MQYLRSAHSYAKIQIALFKGKRPVGAAGAQVPYKHKVTGSNPVPATIELSQVRQVFCLTCFLFRIKFATHLATPSATQQSFRVMNAVFDGLIKGLCFKKCVLRDYSLPVSRGHMELLPDDPRSVLVRSAVLSLRFARHCGEQPVHIVVCWHDA